MPIKYAAIVPHPPLLIPSVGKENISLLADTIGAYKRVAQGLKKNRVDTALIISPHGTIDPEIFTINQSIIYKANFEEFGDFGTKKEWSGSLGLAQQIRDVTEIGNELHLITNEALDHGSSVPLFLLSENIPDLKIIPLYYSGRDSQAHFDFGKLISRPIKTTRRRVAIIASGDLSHRLSKDAPGGYSPKGKKFDNKLIELLRNNNVNGIIGLNPELIEGAGECGLRSILILLGIIHGLKYEPKSLSYEAPFGVGYLVMDFTFKS